MPNKNPGPGHYSVNSTIGKAPNKISFKGEKQINLSY